MRRSVAQAEPADTALAESLFEEGLALLDAQRFEEACAKLEQSQRIAPAVGTAFNLADCYTHVGRLTSAWHLFRDVEEETSLMGQRSRTATAARRARELEPLLPRLAIHVTASTEGLEIRRDGVLVVPAEWETAVPVDIGDHQVSAVAADHLAFHATAHVGQLRETVTVNVPALEIASRAPVIAAPPATSTIRAQVSADSGGGRHDAMVSRRPRLFRAGMIVASAGAMALGVGMYYGVVAFERRHEALEKCGGSTQCADMAAFEQASGLDDRSRQAATISTAMMIAGAVAAVGGVGLIVAGRSGGATLSTTVSPSAAVLSWSTAY